MGDQLGLGRGKGQLEWHQVCSLAQVMLSLQGQGQAQQVCLLAQVFLSLQGQGQLQ